MTSRFPRVSWSRPTAATVADGTLLYRIDPNSLGETHALDVAGIRDSDAEILCAFMDLGVPDAPDDAIRDYALRWGALGLCEHNLPATHLPPPARVNWYPTPSCTLVRPDLPEWDFVEPLDTWRHFARQARSLVAISDQLKHSPPEVGRRDDWRIVFSRSGRKEPWWRQTQAAERFQVATVISEWLVLGNVRPEARWPASKDCHLAYTGGLFGALALQLLLVVSGTDNVEQCCGCQHLYTRNRPPRPGRRNYCEDCRRRQVPQRHAQRDHRAGLSRRR